MIGMMNSPVDNVEFYAANPHARRSGLSEDVLEAFTGVKQRKKITYTADGRRLVDGKIEDTSPEATMRLWGSVVKRGVMTSNVLPVVEEEKKTKGVREQTVLDEMESVYDAHQSDDGKVEDISSESVMELWETTIKRGMLTTIVIPAVDDAIRLKEFGEDAAKKQYAEKELPKDVNIEETPDLDRSTPPHQ